VLRVTLLSDLDRAFHPHADPRNVAMIRRRHTLWSDLARLRGWDLAVCDIAGLDAASDAVHGNVCWIDLPMLPRARYRDVFARAAVLGAACVLERPEEVERVLGLDRAYPVLVRAGVPTPRTAFLPVDDALAAVIDSPAAVRNLLTEAVYGALFDAEIDPHDGVFIRGFYSSAKSANPEHYFGSNQADIEATVFEVIRRLRVALDVGGLALREHLELERIELSTQPGDRDAIRVPFEVRLTVLGGRLVMASYHGPFEALADDPRSTLADALAARRGVVDEAVRALMPALLVADLPPNYVADLAFVRGGAPVVLELNPLYAAGYNVPAAHAVLVAALGADLARRAGYAEPTWNAILDSAAALSGERVEESSAVWLFGPES
jgi:ATP-grasp domain, R2K clade family 3